jgi:hypothetical protein
MMIFTTSNGMGRGIKAFQYFGETVHETVPRNTLSLAVLLPLVCRNIHMDAPHGRYNINNTLTSLPHRNDMEFSPTYTKSCAAYPRQGKLTARGKRHVVP